MPCYRDKPASASVLLHLLHACSDMLALLSDDILTDEGRATQLEFLTRVHMP